MFKPEELVAIASMCEAELNLLELIERRVPGAVITDAQATVAVIRAKAKREIERIEKAAAADAAASQEKKS